MFETQIRDGEVYVFYNGKLIYKRWYHKSGDVQKKDRSVLFDKYGPPTDLPKQ